MMAKCVSVGIAALAVEETGSWKEDDEQ